jgi:hypothetical protein
MNRRVNFVWLAIILACVLIAGACEYDPEDTDLPAYDSQHTLDIRPTAPGQPALSTAR